MEGFQLELKGFLDDSPSVYHAVEELRQSLERHDYIRLEESEAWDLEPGGQYYLTRGGSALVAFRIPRERPLGFMISASHSDRPTFKLKENGEVAGKYTRLATEKYGGMLMAPWLDRPLSVAGRVLVETQDGIESRLLNVDRDLLLIPNLAIHMNRSANENQSWNPAVDTLPLVGSEEAKGKLWALLEEEAGGKILGHDLYLYVRQPATTWGVEGNYISAAGLDDLMCAWCCTRSFMVAEDNCSVPVLSVFDSEEVGSSSVQGAASTLLEDVLARIAAGLQMDLRRMLRNTLLLSADNAHALHPNHPEYSDANNAPILGGGVVLKFNSNLRYTTDGVSAALFRKICQKADAPVQTYYNRADLPGGSTLGNISLSHVSVLSADIGLAQLAMHSCYETADSRDAAAMCRVMETFYGSALEQLEDGSYRLL